MIWPFGHIVEVLRVARIDVAQAAVHRPEPTPPPMIDMTDKLARRALDIAIREIGRGELAGAGDNMGPDVAKYLAPTRPPENWCAALVGWCYEQAAGELGVRLPFARSLGAKRLGAHVAAVGRRFTDPADALPGDLVCWDRGATGSWLGHVGIIEQFTPRDHHVVLCTIEGNSRPTVCRREHPLPLTRFAFFASIRKPPPRVA